MVSSATVIQLGGVPVRPMDPPAGVPKNASERDVTALGALALRDRADLGPFRLAFCEALVRAADWQASANGVL